VANPDPADNEYDGTWYSMVEAGGDLLVFDRRRNDVALVGREIGDAADASVERTILGLALDPEGALYVLENTVCDEPCRPQPNAGRISRVREAGRSGGRVEPIASGLLSPTALVVGPDGGLYVSISGLGPAGAGSVIRLDV
jgi:glucose/arabinose dehydrogenase